MAATCCLLPGGAAYHVLPALVGSMTSMAAIRTQRAQLLNKHIIHSGCATSHHNQHYLSAQLLLTFLALTCPTMP